MAVVYGLSIQDGCRFDDVPFSVHGGGINIHGARDAYLSIITIVYGYW